MQQDEANVVTLLRCIQKEYSTVPQARKTAYIYFFIIEAALIKHLEPRLQNALGADFLDEAFL